MQSAYKAILRARPATVRDAIDLIVTQEGIPEPEACLIVEALWDAGILLATDPAPSAIAFPRSVGSFLADSGPYVREFWIINALNLIALVLAQTIDSGSPLSVLSLVFVLIQVLVLSGWTLLGIILPNIQEPLSLVERFFVSAALSIGVGIGLGIVLDRLWDISGTAVSLTYFIMIALFNTGAAARRVLSAANMIREDLPENSNPTLMEEQA